MLYTFYGDDFTGSTDVLEQLASNGISAVLFFNPPTEDQLARFEGVQAIGIAGDSRSRSPEWMTENLPSIFTALKRFNAPINHYKACSTFDSSPTHGSIGRAIELGQAVFSSEFVPVIVATPHLRRYLVFGNLFAAAPDGTIQRIDRHPMANHPVTPMCEADLCRHLGAQTSLTIGLINLVALRSGNASIELDCLLREVRQIIFFDGLDEHSLAITGDLLWRRAQERSLFSASSSGLTAALVSAWHSAGLISEVPIAHKAIGSQPMFVVSGSCSLATSVQIRWAIDNGFHAVMIDPGSVLNPQTRVSEMTRIYAGSLSGLSEGRNTILYTALGSSSGSIDGTALGVVLGSLLRDLILATNTRRIVLCGGDTSSHALPQLGLYALTWLKQIQTGAPLCRAFSDNPVFDGLELVLKGGQVGTPDFFNEVLQA